MLLFLVSMKASWKYWNMFLISSKKSFSFLRYLSFRADFFGWVGKRIDQFQNLWLHQLGNKKLQYTHCVISEKVKAIRQWNLVHWYNVTCEIFFFKNHAEHVLYYFLNFFCFFKDPYMMSKQVVSTLVSINLRSPHVDIQ